MSERQTPRETCSKCGGDDIHVRYHKRGCPDPKCSCSECSHGSHERRHDEHLHYHCRRCGFDWTGSTLDAKGPC